VIGTTIDTLPGTETLIRMPVEFPEGTQAELKRYFEKLTPRSQNRVPLWIEIDSLSSSKQTNEPEFITFIKMNFYLIKPDLSTEFLFTHTFSERETGGDNDNQRLTLHVRKGIDKCLKNFVSSEWRERVKPEIRLTINPDNDTCDQWHLINSANVLFNGKWALPAFAAHGLKERGEKWSYGFTFQAIAIVFPSVGVEVHKPLTKNFLVYANVEGTLQNIVGRYAGIGFLTLPRQSSISVRCGAGYWQIPYIEGIQQNRNISGITFSIAIGWKLGG
jgi:hypothetical protein